MRIGADFESVLKRGLLEFTEGLPAGAPEMRYAYHEIIEEAQHSLMFHEFVRRSGLEVDHVQRTMLASDRPVHPLLRRIMQIHVTEEARHLCFARHYLREHVPQLGPVRRAALQLRTPIILSVMAQLMMRPSRHVVRRYEMPDAVVAEAYRDNPAHRARTVEALRKVRELCSELDIAVPALWRRLGIWDDASSSAIASRSSTQGRSLSGS
jgi:hypothetical protein